MKLKKNPNCKLADKIYTFSFTCDGYCPKRVEPDNDLKKKGMTCAYQKHSTIFKSGDELCKRNVSIATEK